MIVTFSIVKPEVPMTQERMSPLRERMLEDMRIRGMGDKAQKSHIRAIKDFAKFLKRSPDTATPEELRAYQLHTTDTGVTASTFILTVDEVIPPRPPTLSRFCLWQQPSWRIP